MHLSGGLCSRPECRKFTIAGDTQTDALTKIGQAAHIRGEKKGSARFDENMTDEERDDIKNGLWLCKNCHETIDRDKQGVRYTNDLLFAWRESAIDFANSILGQSFQEVKHRIEAIVTLRNIAMNYIDEGKNENTALANLLAREDLTVRQKSIVYTAVYEHLNKRLPDEDPFKRKCSVCDIGYFLSDMEVYTRKAQPNSFIVTELGIHYRDLEFKVCINCIESKEDVELNSVIDRLADVGWRDMHDAYIRATRGNEDGYRRV